MALDPQHGSAVDPPGVAGGLSIRGKILAAFVALSAISGGVGAYAISSLSQSGRLVAQTYDRPLMSISFARQVLADFSRLESTFARRLMARTPRDAQALDQQVAARAAELDDDLDVVAERSTSERARKAAEKVRAAVADWTRESKAALAQTGVADWSGLDRSSAVVNEQIDLLVNYAAGDGFIGRQEALAAIGRNTQVQLTGTVAALLLSLAVVILLTHRIVGPVASASRAANRIASGELDVHIPVTGRDELASLLGAMAIMRDNIRAMVEKEVALRRSAQVRLVDAIESSREGFIVVDGEGKIVVANAEMAGCFSAVATQVGAGQDYRGMIRAGIEKGVFAAKTPAEREALVARLESPDDLAPLEEQLADGRWVRISRNRTAEGGVIAIFSDITLQKEREAVLREAKDRAEAANRTKTEFLANMSHELRTPLNAVIGFSELMQQEALGPLGQPKYKEFMTDILGSARRLLAIINDILEWSNVEAGHLALNIEAIDVGEAFEDTRRSMAEAFAEARVAFHVRPAGGLSVNADRAKLGQVLRNLLSNAAKFTPAGGTTDVSARQASDGIVEIVIADTGIGMRPEDIAVALSPFGQVDGRLARKYEGTGLGLALTKAFVERHGGTLTLESERDKGTKVIVRLPAAVQSMHRVA